MLLRSVRHCCGSQKIPVDNAMTQGAAGSPALPPQSSVHRAGRVARAPFRVDLAGGWTDLVPYTHDCGGAAVNFAINKYVTARAGDDGDVTFTFDVPSGSGLGTSGALHVARLAALTPAAAGDAAAIAAAAYEAELAAGNLCGKQDQLAAAHGGFNRFVFAGDAVERMPIAAAPSARSWLREHLLVANSCIVHNSGEIMDGVWGRYAAGDAGVREGLAVIRGAAQLMHDALQSDARDAFAAALHEGRRGVDLLHPSINAPFLPVVAPLAEAGHVVGWKALGAGAGGCAALLCDSAGIGAVRAAVTAAGWSIIDWDYDDVGVTVEKA
jgi:D-glycero-alpha-D-manno-heptose-7-phosphate kinase